MATRQSRLTLREHVSRRTARSTSGDRVTLAELAVVDRLAAAWNAFLELPIEHPSDRDEFLATIHRAQNQVLARPGRR